MADRSEMVCVRSFKTAQVKIKGGVPQKFVLSPLLFNLYVNDVSTRASSCVMFCYADHTTLVSCRRNYYHSARILQDGATRVIDRFGENLIRSKAL